MEIVNETAVYRMWKANFNSWYFSLFLKLVVLETVRKSAGRVPCSWTTLLTFAMHTHLGLICVRPSVRPSVCCVTLQRVGLIVIPFCLSVWMSVGHSATYSLPRLIDHNQIWSAGIYLSWDPCKPFWIPHLPYFRRQREKYATRILATANVTHRAILLVCLSVCLCLSVHVPSSTTVY